MNSMPAHPVVVTDYEGEHHVFQMPDEPISNRKVGVGIETRGYQLDNDGGYIIASGSRMPDGRGWSLVKGTPSLRDALPPLPPQWLIELCRPPKPANTAPQTTYKQPGKAEEAYAMSALDRAASELARMQPSTGRDNKLLSVAGTMGRMIAPGWIGQATVEGRLFDACRANGLDREMGDTDILDKIKRGIEATMSNPHPPLPERQRGNGKDTEAAEHHRQPIHDWSDPDWSILDARRGDLPEFPLHVFSEKFQAMIERTAKGAGVTSAHVAVPLLGIASSVIGIARQIEATKSWLQPTTCWAALIGYSGTGKTPGINVSKRAVNKVRELCKAAEEERRLKYETKQEAALAARKAWKKSVEEAAANGTPAPLMPASAIDPGPFIPLRLYVADATIERLADLLQARPQGMLMLRDELAALFLNMSRYNGGQDNEFWLESWNGDSHPVERMGRTRHVEHLLVGIVGGMQPDKLETSFEGDHDGMYARVLFSWPQEPGCADLNNDADEIDCDVLNIMLRVNRLAVFEDDHLIVKKIPLSAEAWEGFAQFRQFAHEAKEAFEGREREWHAKMTAHVLRLACAITFVEWAITTEATEPGAVPGAAMDAAIELVRDYFWPHARACLRQIGLTQRHADARRVLRWLKANQRREVSREDVRRDALAQRLDADQTTELLAGLVRHGWLKEETAPSGPQGGKPARRWRVNPRLFSRDPTAETAETAETSQ